MAADVYLCRGCNGITECVKFAGIAPPDQHLTHPPATVMCNCKGCGGTKERHDHTEGLSAVINFVYELKSQDQVRRHIRQCEGQHVQQAVFSTFMNCLTQVCFTCQRVRGSISWYGSRSWIVEVDRSE